MSRLNVRDITSPPLRDGMSMTTSTAGISNRRTSIPGVWRTSGTRREIQTLNYPATQSHHHEIFTSHVTHKPQLPHSGELFIPHKGVSQQRELTYKKLPCLRCTSPKSLFTPRKTENGRDRKHAGFKAKRDA